MATGVSTAPTTTPLVESEQTLLILGASGDLSARLLLPGLGALLAAGGAAEDVSLVGSDVADWDDERWRARVAESFAAGGASGALADAVTRSSRYFRTDVTSEGEWRRLLDACAGRVAIYFALPPTVTERACETLWQIIAPVLEAWRSDDVPLEEYPAGSTGPHGWPLPGRSPISPSVAGAPPVAA